MMMNLDELLKERINITPEMEKKAENIYKVTSEFLSKSLEAYSPDIFPQGSFKLKTIIRPVEDKDEFDLDFVCLLDIAKSDINQKELYTLLGDTLNKNYKKPMLEPKKRCWRLNYENFHVDILPAIPDPDFINGQTPLLLIPDKDKKEWQSTNPLGYAQWFNSCASQGQRRSFVENSIQPLPKQDNNLLLQKIVKIMKYHRNFIFRNDLDNRPISMIVTTLAAKNYNGEQDLAAAFSKICVGIKSEAQEILNSGILLNPVDSRENFADAWKKHPKRKENFRIWVEKLDDLTNRYSHIIVQNSKIDLSKLLFEHFGYATKLETRSPNISQPHIITDPSKQWYK